MSDLIRPGIALLLLASPCFTLACGTGSAPPNVLFIYVDDQGWTGTSVAMDPENPASRSDFFQTPSLERLGREGMTFSQAYAPAAICSPSRASVLTGRSPAGIGITDVIEAADPNHSHHQRNIGKKLRSPIPHPGLPEGEVTYAEFITRHRPEYATAHFGKWHLSSGGPERHGFHAGDGDVGGWSRTDEEPENPKDTIGITTRALAFIGDQVESGRPFVVQVSYQAVHLFSFARAETVVRTRARASGERHRNPRFAAMTEELDEAIGSILDGLDALEIADATYVVVTSDNGAAVVRQNNNLPLRSGKLSLYEGGIRVPMLVRGPSIEPGSHSPVPVIGWDLFPTFREWLEIAAPLPGHVEGGSLVALLERRGGCRAPTRRPRLVRAPLLPAIPDEASTVGSDTSRKPQAAARLRDRRARALRPGIGPRREHRPV